MTTYTIAIYRERLLACVPDGTDLEPYIANMGKHLRWSIDRDRIDVKTGLTLTDDMSDVEFPEWDPNWDLGGGANLEDETGRVWLYAVRRA